MIGPVRLRLAVALAPRRIDAGRGVTLLFAAPTPAALRAIGHDLALRAAGGRAASAADQLDTALAHLMTGAEGVDIEDPETGAALDWSPAAWADICAAEPWLRAASRLAVQDIVAAASEAGREGNALPPSSSGASGAAPGSAPTAARAAADGTAATSRAPKTSTP